MSDVLDEQETLSLPQADEVHTAVSADVVVAVGEVVVELGGFWWLWRQGVVVVGKGCGGALGSVSAWVPLEARTSESLRRHPSSPQLLSVILLLQLIIIRYNVVVKTLHFIDQVV